MDLFIFGAGYSGRAIAKALRNSASRMAGTTRSESNADLLARAAISPFVFGGSVTASLSVRLKSVTHLIQSIAPGETGDPIAMLGAERLRLLMPELQWVGYLSTVGVYGDHAGAWVDETTPCRPVSSRSLQRIKAENLWTDFAAATNLPVAHIRLSGIYGPGRNALKTLDAGKARRLIKKDQVFNRIRVEDIGGAVSVLANAKIGGVFNVTDDEPAPPQDVVSYAASLMGRQPPPEVDFETADITPMARSFYGENKRVSNGAIKALGYKFQFPNYRIALEELWTSRTWAG